jgi:hypothetical protein
MKGSFICPQNPIQLHGVGQISIPSNSRKLKRSIYTDQNHCFAISGRPPSALSIHHSQFACLRATHRQAAGNNLKGLLYLWERLGEGFGPKAKKETPAPINRKRLRKKFPGHTLRVKAAHADESSKSLSKANPVEFDGVGQKPIPSNSKGLKHSIYADQNHSAFIPQNSLFAYGATVPSEQKETPGPLNRKRSRKGS